ncbi:uncharacterized protein LOC131158399 [Malania oleifera]|uniref:uncharacterized protein LOC131158399 n=1 Tax=Malania oleifera TaxID=397392 RepID=UPI0025AE9D1B|nr:uncharacterized protein LOC131158399 [Malania oleifera]
MEEDDYQERLRKEAEEEEAEEAASLSDFPLNANDRSDAPSSSQPPLSFEFSSHSIDNPDIVPADDIIFCGKLVPLKQQPSTSLTKPHKIPNTNLRRRSESLSELHYTNRSNSTTSFRFTRNSRSLDFQKLASRSSSSQASPASEIDRNSSVKSVGKSDATSVRKAPKSRWYQLPMFGLVKFPPEMELKDIKSRQSRRNPTALFPPADPGMKVPISRSAGKGPWTILRALSCRDDASVAVATSFRCIPQV